MLDERVQELYQGQHARSVSTSTTPQTFYVMSVFRKKKKLKKRKEKQYGPVQRQVVRWEMSKHKPHSTELNVRHGKRQRNAVFRRPRHMENFENGRHGIRRKLSQETFQKRLQKRLYSITHLRISFGVSHHGFRFQICWTL